MASNKGSNSPHTGQMFATLPLALRRLRLMKDVPAFVLWRLCLMWVDWIRLIGTSMASRWSLTLLNLLGIVLAVGLLSSAAFFAQAVDRALIQEQLDALSRQTGRAPFSLRLYLLPSTRRPLPLRDAERVAANVAQTLAAEIGLPAAHLGVEVQSGSLMLQPAPDDMRYTGSGSYVSMVNAVYIADVIEQIEVVSGRPMDPDGAQRAPPPENALDVWMHADMAAEMGVNEGETFQLALNARYPIGLVQIAGLWKARDHTDPFWFNDPDANLRDALLVRRQDYIRSIQPVLASGSRLAAWHIRLDDDGLNPALAQDYVRGFQRSMTIIERYLPGAQLDVSPLEPLQHFVARKATLTRWLLLFNLPALFVLLYFLLLVAQIGMRRQRREISIFVSRGMGKVALLSMTITEHLLLVLIGLPLGIAGGMGLARLMGNTTGFLTFAARPPLQVTMQGFEPWLIGLALSFTLVVRVVPLLGLASKSITHFERAEARSEQRPFWLRTYLDLLLLAPTAYVYHQLSQGASMANPTADGAAAFLQDPLLVLAPALFLVTASLLLMRLFPLLMYLLGWFATRTPRLTIHLALRQLSRHAQSYITSMLLVTALLAMGMYMVSLASSLDQWMVDQVYYRIGADARFMPVRSTDAGAEFVVAPPGMFDDLPGVAATTRVGDYPMEIWVSNGSQSVRQRGRFLAIDRDSFPAVAWFRRDFASEALGALMNRLAVDPENILVSAHFLQEHQLRIGDTLSLEVALEEGVKLPSNFTIAGVYTHFPTVNEDELAFVGNLATLTLIAGAEFPHHVWLRLQPGADAAAAFDAVSGMNLTPGFNSDAAAIIGEEQTRLERVGIFGTLSIGFLAAVLMTALSLLVHGFAALRARAYQFGVLQALGLPRRQVLTQVVMEYTLLTSYSAAGGAAIGLLTTYLFAPFLQTSAQSAGAESLPVPPLLPLLALDKMAQLALLFALIMVFLQLLVLVQGLHRRFFSTVALGHQG